MAKIIKPATLHDRVPPGQTLTDKFPVLTYGPVPPFNPATWDFRIFGTVTQPLRLSYEQFLALPRARMVADFHCVTTWSRLDNVWEGVLVSELMKLVELRPQTNFVLVHCEYGYTTNLPLGEFNESNVMLADHHDGRVLEPDHGFPLRLVVPKLYAWKSAKWVRAIEFRERDQRGFWEVRGYHNHADPWTEERYSAQEDLDE